LSSPTVKCQNDKKCCYKATATAGSDGNGSGNSIEDNIAVNGKTTNTLKLQKKHWQWQQ